MNRQEVHEVGLVLRDKEPPHAEDNWSLYRVVLLLIAEDRVLSLAVSDLSDSVSLFIVDGYAALHEHEGSRALESFKLSGYVFYFFSFYRSLCLLSRLFLRCGCRAFGATRRPLGCLIHNDIKLK